MTAQRTFDVPRRLEPPAEDPLLAADDPVEAALRHVAGQALRPGPIGAVGLELELHLVDLARPSRRPTWGEIAPLPRVLGPMPAGSAVTFEPGGQVELSTPVAAGAVEAVQALRTDSQALRQRLAESGFGAAALGSDPARTAGRVHPHPRYHAMEEHFDALGCAGAGRDMMTATAALQVNLEAGPESGWADRLRLVRTLVPMLVAASSTSPWLGGRTSGWHSMRQGVWQGIDHGRTDPVPRGDPAEAWASYALDAPVMLVRDPASDGSVVRAVRERIPFGQWLRGAAGGRAPFDRAPTLADLDYHLTTLFPPVRPRGYLELRCLDAMPERWWPGLAALVVTLADDPLAADEAADACAPVADSWETAARHGLADPSVRAAVLACAEIAVRRCDPALRGEVEAFASCLEQGSPSEVLRGRIDAVGPVAVLEEEARG